MPRESAALSSFGRARVLDEPRLARRTAAIGMREPANTATMATALRVISL